MKLFSAVLASALFAASAGIASATTINLASYGSTNTKPAGVGNTATAYNGALYGGILPGASGPSYDIGTGGVWHAPLANSSWVSNDPGNYPGGNNVEPTGLYFYSTSFTDLDPLHSSGTISVLADDTTGVFFNGVQITPGAGFATSGTCASGQPNCTEPVTYLLTNFVSGVNTLAFDVQQLHGSAEGVDFAGKVNVTPEPSSLMLMGTGLMSVGGLLSRRRRFVA